MALLGAWAYQALRNSGQRPQAPLGLVKPGTRREESELQRRSEVIFRAMINAVKADGRIDENEIDKIIGKLRESGGDAQEERYMLTQLQKPMETRDLVAEAQDQPELGVEIYAASLLAIEVDTTAERDYLKNLATDLGLTPEVTRNIENLVGLQPA